MVGVGPSGISRRAGRASSVQQYRVCGNPAGRRYDAGVSNPSGVLRHPVVTAAAGAGAVAAEGVSTVYRTATRLPFVGERLNRSVAALSPCRSSSSRVVYNRAV
jgi:hypothetical protein